MTLDRNVTSNVKSNKVIALEDPPDESLQKEQRSPQVPDQESLHYTKVCIACMDRRLSNPSCLNSVPKAEVCWDNDIYLPAGGMEPVLGLAAETCKFTFCLF